MTDLDQLHTSPRAPELVRRIARRIEPATGFVAYGALYLFVSVFAGLALAIGLALLASAIGVAKDSAAQTAAVWLGFAVGGALAWWPFAIWVRRKRGRAATLARDGVLVEGRVATRMGDRAIELAARLAIRAAGGGLVTHWDRVEFEHGGKSYAVVCPFVTAPAQGAVATVLFHPDARYALGFGADGHGYPSRIHRSR